MATKTSHIKDTPAGKPCITVFKNPIVSNKHTFSSVTGGGGGFITSVRQ